MSTTINKYLGVFLAGAALCLSACNRYSVAINENVVYQPPLIFADYDIRDTALKTCVQSTIAEKKLTRAEHLKSLVCPPGNITALKGLETFKNLEYLGLNDNKISNLASLGTLTKLKQLSVKNNAIVDFSPVGHLSRLDLIDASGNTFADCVSLRAFLSRTKVRLPHHCKAESIRP